MLAKTGGLDMVDRLWGYRDAEGAYHSGYMRSLFHGLALGARVSGDNEVIPAEMVANAQFGVHRRHEEQSAGGPGADERCGHSRKHRGPLRHPAGQPEQDGIYADSVRAHYFTRAATRDAEEREKYLEQEHPSQTRACATGLTKELEPVLEKEDDLKKGGVVTIPERASVDLAMRLASNNSKRAAMILRQMRTHGVAVTSRTGNKYMVRARVQDDGSSQPSCRCRSPAGARGRTSPLPRKRT